MSRIYREILQLNRKKNQITWFKNGQRIWMDVSPKVITDGQQMCEKMIHVTNPQSTREMEIKTKRPYFLTSIRKIPLLLSRFRRVRLFRDPWTVAHQVPLSMGFSRQEYWNGLPFLSPQKDTIRKKKKKPKITSVGEDGEKLEPYCSLWDCKMVQSCGNQYASSSKSENYHGIQQFHFWVYTHKNWKQNLEEVFAH